MRALGFLVLHPCSSFLSLAPRVSVAPVPRCCVPRVSILWCDVHMQLKHTRLFAAKRAQWRRHAWRGWRWHLRSNIKYQISNIKLKKDQAQVVSASRINNLMDCTWLSNTYIASILIHYTHCTAPEFVSRSSRTSRPQSPVSNSACMCWVGVWVSEWCKCVCVQ